MRKSPLGAFLQARKRANALCSAFSPNIHVASREGELLGGANHAEVETFRKKVRSNSFSGPTSGVCHGALQANVMILPADHALDFTLFCLRNYKSCPLLYVGEKGDPGLGPFGGNHGDIRSDLPRYLVWHKGRIIESKGVLDIKDLWRDDLVTFLLGCSFSFEQALQANGLTPRNVQANTNVSMFRTNIPSIPSGPFHGPLVVSMRPYKRSQLEQVYDITSNFPAAHGTPIHWGDPAEIGIKDISKPDYGDPLPFAEDDDVPVFWCCGVTPQSALVAASDKVNFAVTHFPGHMLVCDPSN